MTSIEECAERGAKFLDRCVPRWEKRIDVDALAMSRCDKCILGQLYGSFGVGMVRIGAQFPLEASSTRLGFALNVVMPGDWNRLANAWRAEVRKRTGAKP